MRRRFLCLPVFLFFASTILGDQITLKNGDRLTGQITTGDVKTLLLKAEFVGEVTIQWDAITAIESSDVLHLTLKDGKRLSGKITTRDGRFVVAGVPEATPPAAKDTVVAVRNDAEQRAFDAAAERLAHPKFIYFWGGVFDTGLALTRGNSSTTSYTLSGKAIRETARDKLTLYTTYVYASDNTTIPNRTTANAIRAGVRGDLNISPRVFIFAFADYETNELQTSIFARFMAAASAITLLRPTAPFLMSSVVSAMTATPSAPTSSPIPLRRPHSLSFRRSPKTAPKLSSASSLTPTFPSAVLLQSASLSSRTFLTPENTASSLTPPSPCN
jgi:hypothetical protein